MWGAEVSGGDVVLARIPLSAFATGSATPLGGQVYTPLPAPEGGSGYGFRNRFVGDTVLYNVDDAYDYYGYYNYDSPSWESDLVVYPVGGRGAAHVLKVAHRIERIEALGDDAVVIGQGPLGLQLTAIRLGQWPSVAGTYIEPSVSQGEQRSHGFFYREDDGDSGVLGLPLQFGGSDYGYLTESSVAVLYLAVENLHLQPLGTLNARADSIDDGCVASCVDWYGNSRPIFYRGRAFALMGYELVEGAIAEGAIHEVARVHLLADQPNARVATWQR
jgi:hypothetical protein